MSDPAPRYNIQDFADTFEHFNAVIHLRQGSDHKFDMETAQTVCNFGVALADRLVPEVEEIEDQTECWRQCLVLGMGEIFALLDLASLRGALCVPASWCIALRFGGAILPHALHSSASFCQQCLSQLG